MTYGDSSFIPASNGPSDCLQAFGDCCEGQYLVFGVFDIDENVSEGVNCFGCVRERTEKFYASEP